MEYLKSGWKTVVGGQTASVMDEQPNVAETVERLVERVETSTLLEDRRDACRALKSLSKTYRLEVGAQAMDALLFVLQNDTTDNEIIAFALETLNNIIGTDEDIGNTGNNGTDLSVQFTEIFIKRKENVQLIIDLLAEFDFKIRWPTIKLLYSLLRNKLRECQDCILTYPMGISRMMDLLLDPREVIRNDALLLLVYLTKNNTNIQKIVAFENAFDRILDIVTSEGCSEGGIIVEDCLSILLNLLKTNTSNQNFFKEGSYINKLLPFLDFSFDTSWNPQKINNLLLMFKVIRSLVSPKNPTQVTSACQKVMNQNEVLQKLCAILMSNGIPAEILTETINCVAEVIRGNQVNQDYFSRVNAPIEPPKPVIVILLMSMTNEKQPFELRCAVLYCFQCFLYKNDLGQAQIVETLLPSSTVEVPILSAGQLLCSGFFTYDPLSNWFVAVALSYTLLGNVTQKKQLLRVKLQTDVASPPTSLLSYCSNLLQQGGHYQRRVSLLMLLSTWLSNSGETVSEFVSISTNIPYLTSQVALIEGEEVELIVQGLCAFLIGICICYNDNSVPSFTKNDLFEIINNRVGKETFVDKLSLISKNEKFSHAIQKPQLSYLKASDVLFDYEFCNLFRSQESSILKILQSGGLDGNSSHAGNNNSTETNLSSEEHKLLNKYKELIRQQDDQLTLLKKQLTDYQTQNEYQTHQLNEQHSLIQQLRDQVALLKAQKLPVYDPTSTNFSGHHHHTSSPVINDNQQQQYPSFIASGQQQPPLIHHHEHHPLHHNRQSESINSDSGNVSAQNYDHNTGYPYNNDLTAQNVQQLTNQMNSLQVDPDENPSVPAHSALTSGSAEEIDYLRNENRRLLSIIDEYKYWEQNWTFYNNNSPTGQYSTGGAVVGSQLPAMDNTLSTQVNVSDSDISRNVSEPDQQKPQAPDSNQDLVEKLKFERDSLKKEQDELLTLLGDQNLRLQFYENVFKEHGLEINLTTDIGTTKTTTISMEQNNEAENTKRFNTENNYFYKENPPSIAETRNNLSSNHISLINENDSDENCGKNPNETPTPSAGNDIQSFQHQPATLMSIPNDYHHHFTAIPSTSSSQLAYPTYQFNTMVASTISSPSSQQPQMDSVNLPSTNS